MTNNNFSVTLTKSGTAGLDGDLWLVIRQIVELPISSQDDIEIWEEDNNETCPLAIGDMAFWGVIWQIPVNNREDVKTAALAWVEDHPTRPRDVCTGPMSKEQANRWLSC